MVRDHFLLPLREKVAPEGGRMRGRADLSARNPHRDNPFGRRDPSSVSLREPPSPARGEGSPISASRQAMAA